MKVILKFDYHSDIIYIPDGYIKNLNEVYMKFFDWLAEQPECLINKDGICGLSYDENDFLKYINDEVLEGIGEKAYFVRNVINSKEKQIVLNF